MQGTDLLSGERIPLSSRQKRKAHNASLKRTRAGFAARRGVHLGDLLVRRRRQQHDLVNDALQLFGGYGYLRDYPIERFWRDLRVHSILEGTNQIMRMVVGRDLLRQ